MSDTDLSESIAENAAGPAKASIDGNSADQHSLADQIEADRYLASKRAARRGCGFRLIKFTNGGTV